MTHTPVAQTRAGSLAEQSIAAYIAPLVEGRRVAVVGPSSVPVASLVRALGAQSVVALGGSGEGVAQRPLNAGAIEAFRSRIDCVIVPEASAVGLRRVLDESRRALGRDGILVVGASAREGGLEFHRLRDTLEERFGVVKMYGGGAFAGFALAALDDAAGEVALDTRLMPEAPESPSFFVGVASDGEFALDPYAIVQVPAGPERVAPVGPSEADLARIEGLERALSQATAELGAQRERATTAATALDAAQLREQQGRQALDRLAAELEAARGDLASARVEAYRGRQRLADLERAVSSTEARTQELRSACEQAERDRDHARRDVARLRKEGQERELAIEADVSSLERALGERGRECDSLRRQVQDRDAAVRELLFELDRARAEGDSPELLGLRARNAELASLHAAVGAEAGRLALQNDVLRERASSLESMCEFRDAELKQLGFQLEQARANASSRSIALEAARLRAEHETELAAERARGEERLAAAKAESETLVAGLRAQIETASALHNAEQAARAARARDEADEEAARLRAEAESQRRRAVDAEVALRSTLARMTELESSESEARARAASAETRLSEARHGVLGSEAGAEALRQANEEHAALLRAAKAEGAGLRAALQSERERFHEVTSQLERARAEALDLGRQLDDSLRSEEDLQAQLEHARSELSRQLALAASLDDQSEALRLELSGARRGALHRTRELEAEIEQLVRALEVSNVHSATELDALSRLRRDTEAHRAERDGLSMRLADAELALSALQTVSRAEDGARASVEVEGDEDPSQDAAMGGSERADQLLATLADTAARLASTEERFAALQADFDAARALSEQREAAARSPAAATRETDPSSEVLEALRRESAEREQLARSLVAQIEDRDLRLRALERRLADEVDRARRTESEIWELELRARDQRLIELQRELDRATGADAGELSELRASVSALKVEQGRSLESLEKVRAGLSSILIEGRGASVAHELIALLRQLESRGDR
jgi:hypothetical protein